MKKYNLFTDKLVDFDTFVTARLRTHNCTSVSYGLTKADMYDILDSAKVKYKKSVDWDTLFSVLLNNTDYDLRKLAHLKNIGVSSQDYQREFGISHQEVKRLEKFGVLQVVNTYRVRNYGKYLFVPLYDVCQFEDMTTEDMQQFLLKYSKGKRKREKNK